MDSEEEELTTIKNRNSENYIYRILKTDVIYCPEIVENLTALLLLPSTPPRLRNNNNIV